MFSELHQAYDLIMQAVKPEDIFGTLQNTERSEKMGAIDEIWKGLKGELDPDRYSHNLDAFELAREASLRIDHLYKRAKEKVINDSYGLESTAKSNEISTPKRTYRISETMVRGDLSTLFEGQAIGEESEMGKVVIKIVDDPADNSFLRKEMEVLTLFQKSPAKQMKHLPVLLDEFITTRDQQGIVLRYIEGIDFYTIREHYRYKNGVSPKHMVWMLNRLLSVLGFAHSRGIVHGNIDPSHLMIRPQDHNLWLIDWCYASVNPRFSGDAFRVFNEDFSPPEVAQRKPPIPSSDLYSAGKCMIFILGGDIQSDSMPSSVPEPLQRFLKFMVMKSPLQRAQDAWQLHPQLITLVENLWGPRKFIEFKI